MRPIHLSMTAFGPFAKTEFIDFEMLGKNPLFLINGQTGSGKTTILDAICFALYHKTTGNEREPREMRCDYAAPDDLTSVTFVFELAEQRYKIERIPEQERPKLRGEGVSKQPAKATLERLTAATSELMVAAKVTDATHAIEQLMGLKVDQFRQVMVLPQGQFRKLLMADSKDRETIFSQLFETGIYKRIEEDLSRQAKSLWVRREKLKDNQQGVLKTAGLENVEQLDNAVLTLAPDEIKAQQQYQKKEAFFISADRAHRDAIVLQNDFNSLAILEQKKQSIDSRKDTMNRQRKRKEQAEQALVLIPVYDELQRRSEELNLLEEKVVSTQARLKQTKQRKVLATEEKKKNEPRIQQLDQFKNEKSHLERTQQSVHKLKKIETDAALAKQKYQAQQVQQQQLKDNQQALLESITKARQEKQQLEKSVTEQPELKVEINQAENQLQNRQQLEQILTQVNELEEQSQQKLTEIDKQKKHCQQAQLTVKKTDLAWHQGQAVVLAEALQQDQPCPVCGSETHPFPAAGTHPVPSNAERKTVQLEAERAEQQLHKITESLNTLNNDLKHQRQREEELTQTLGELSSRRVDELEQHLSKLFQIEQQQQAQKKRLSELDNLNSAYEQSAQALIENLDAVTLKVNQCAEIYHRAEASLNERLSELPEEFLDADALTQALENSATKVSALEKNIATADSEYLQTEKLFQGLSSELKAVQQQLLNAQTVIKQTNLNWTTTLEKSDLASIEKFKNAILNDEELLKLSNEIQQFDQTTQETIGAIKQQSQLLNEKKPPDLDKSQSSLKVASEEKRLAEKAWQSINQQLITLKEYQKALQKFALEQKDLEEEYQVIGTLADAANGRTGAKVSLQRFVLAVMLDEVLLQAGKRLRLMSKNRYQLHRQRDRTRSRGASGLELVVEDAYSGKTRPVGTLSGGESFLASLSLALGLSDVVQARSGGIRLDTLFIDEGFGSLDSESLDLAIRTLIDLKNAGRMVGIISHVSELKEQITQRIDVIKSPGGSQINLIQ